MSTLTFDTSELRKLSLAKRGWVRLVNWLKQEYRLIRYARIRWKAENGDPFAQYALGTICEAGNGVFRPVAEALKWYQKAAFQGVSQAQLTLGLKYLGGQGVPANDAEALLWLRKAAEQGQAEAQYHLANLYRDGRGTPRDLLQASKWYRKAADRGHSVAKKHFKEINAAQFASDPVEVPAAKDAQLNALVHETT